MFCNAEAFVRAVLLLATTLCLHLIWTPPYNAAANERVLVPTGHRLHRNVDAIMMFNLRVVPFPLLGRIFFWTVAIGESLQNLTSLFGPPSGHHTALNIPLPVFTLLCIVVIIGCAIRHASYRALGRLFTFELAKRSQHKLVTTGPFAYVRHPAYAGWFIMLVGIAPLFLGWPLHVLPNVVGIPLLMYVYGMMGVISTSFALRMEFEDRLLREQFGDEWERWRKQVPNKLVPYVI
ncbi:hypothetical protein CYLTODRAFT_373614 [Cylindrobasidium torrendii FP15055 ss-10]|uniref:Protein-S-isoprenylcysteine O-methyltransferase n=1 Tax=Cylindrobasidium torrendii FP15055 ss-10 TaxID=1314674 RepID=A0A0D7BEG7_9AGAR|nr:hypothetical protein CYLTODRAFT_373614 [Cylindrobasidium torrendii FP15055 ss-10]